MKVVNSKFVDRTYEDIKLAVEKLSFLYHENAQVYGALAQLMLDTGVHEFELTLDDRKAIYKNYSVHFVKANPDDEEDETVLVQLVKHEYEEDEHSDS